MTTAKPTLQQPRVVPRAAIDPDSFSSFGFSLVAIHAQAGASSRKAGSAHSDDMSRSRRHMKVSL
jgi:hypothetical protein